VIRVILKIYTSQGSAAMQSRCGGIFSFHFITSFPQNAVRWKKKSKIGQYLATTWTKVCGLLVGPPCIC